MTNSIKDAALKAKSGDEFWDAVRISTEAFLDALDQLYDGSKPYQDLAGVLARLAQEAHKELQEYADCLAEKHGVTVNILTVALNQDDQALTATTLNSIRADVKDAVDAMVWLDRITRN